MLKLAIYFLISLNSLSGFEPIVISGLGIEMSPPKPELLMELRLRSSYGVFVERVYPGSFAGKCGLKQDDLIVSVNDKLIEKMRNIKEIFGKIQENDDVKVLIYRNNEPQLVYGKYFNTPVTIINDYDDMGEEEYRNWSNSEIAPLERKKKTPNESLHRTAK